MKLSIQTSLALLFLAILLISLPVFLYLSLRISTQMIDRQVRYQMESEAAKSVELVEMILKPVKSDLNRLSGDYSLQRFLRVQAALRRIGLDSSRRPALEEEVEIYRWGAKDEFRRLLELNSEYEQVVFVDAAENVVLEEIAFEGDRPAGPSKDLIKRTLAGEPGEFQVEDRVLERGILRYAIPVIRDENVGVEEEALEPALALLGAPLRTREGVLILDYRFTALTERILATPVIGTTGGALFLIDAEGNLLAARQQHRTLLESFLSDWRSRQSGVQLTWKHSWRGQAYLLSLWPDRNRRWYLGVVAPQSEFTLYLEQASWKLILASLFSFVVAMLVALILIRRISSPLQRFALLARQIARGNFGVRVSSQGGREISNLATAFNEMAGQLEDYVEEVRKKEQLEQELKIAQNIQRGLLPKQMPEMPGMRVCARTVPAREVGGDYYDFLTNGSGSLGLAVGDVTGRGVPAALLMTMIRSVFRSQAREGSPEEVLSKINHLIHEDVRDSRHSVALCFGVVDPQRKVFHFTNAGQMFPLFYRRRSRRWEYLELGGIPLGIRRDVTYRSVEVELEPGDRIVFYTDGLVESTDESQEIFGFERFEALVKETGNLPVDQAVEAILNRLRSFGGADDPDDDLTLAILEICS